MVVEQRGHAGSARDEKGCTEIHKRLDFHVFDVAGSSGVDVMITDPTAPSYIQRGWDESRLMRECERTKREKHVLNGATMNPLVMTTLGK